MRTFDLTPLFRSSVGFDRMMQLVDSALTSDESSGYPPYNIEKLNDETYRITMAVAGFEESDLEIVIHDNTLVIAGKVKPQDTNLEYLHRGIAGRAFERHFQLADFIKVGDAELKNGLLSIELEREVPEALKPRKIKIQNSSRKEKLIEQK